MPSTVAEERRFLPQMSREQAQKNCKLAKRYTELAQLLSFHHNAMSSFFIDQFIRLSLRLIIFSEPHKTIFIKFNAEVMVLAIQFSAKLFESV